jgi:hypothetical protein
MRTAALLIIVALTFASDATASAAEEEAVETTEETEGEERDLSNALAFGASYSYHALRARTDAETGEPLPRGEHLGGFVISYSRHLIPERLAITIAKPFLFNKDRFDTPFDLLLRGLLRRGDWEGFLGVLVTWNIRIFEKEREAKEGERNVLSLGVGAVLGGAYFFNARWSLDLEAGYAYVPTGDIVTHEVTGELTAVYHF